MKKYVLAIAVILGGCASIPGKTWFATSQKDEFTDVVTKMVTVGSFSSGGAIYTFAGGYYPFVGLRNGGAYIGIRSGGNRIPTGTVQIRIDDNPAWTITPNETPTEFIPGTAPIAGGNAKVSADAMASMAKIMSPYTAVTGSKANDILREMVHGKVMRYRTVGLNQAASSTGEVKLDDSLPSALREIGIDPSAL